jgi:hypothetical protein
MIFITIYNHSIHGVYKSTTQLDSKVLCIFKKGNANGVLHREKHTENKSMTNDIQDMTLAVTL